MRLFRERRDKGREKIRVLLVIRNVVIIVVSCFVFVLGRFFWIFLIRISYR